MAYAHLSLRRLILGMLSLSCLTPLCLATAKAQEFDSRLWGTDGNVTAITRHGSALYVAGSFTMAGPVSGGGVSVDRDTGLSLSNFPRVAGVVRTVIPDGAGGWFIGGRFRSVGGLRRQNLAHISANGAITSPTPTVNGEVLALARTSATLFVGGTFDTVGGVPRLNIVGVDLLSGSVLSLAPDPDGAVRALLVHEGRLFVGGDFGTIGSQQRNSLAEVDTTTGIPTNWNPDVGFAGTPGSVRALAAAADTVYVGGLFWNVGSASRRHLAAIFSTTALPTSWAPVVTGPAGMVYGDPYVNALAVRAGSIFVGGHFTGIDSTVRGGLAEVRGLDGAVTAWDPKPGPWSGTIGRDVTCLTLGESTLVAGGYFESMGGTSRRFAAEVSLQSGLPTGWNPQLNQGAYSVAANASSAYLGGSFTGLGPQWRIRHNLAAFDTTTGALLDWDPNPDGYIVTALAAMRGAIYVGGYFTMIGRQPRFGLASLDTLTGLATSWDPVANSVVGSILVVGDTMYVGGYFTTMSGQPRGRLASFDLQTGALTDWSPNAGSDVYCLAERSGKIIVGGFFRSIGGVGRNRLAAVDRITAVVTPWDPNADSWVNTVALVGDSVYVGGRFRTMGGLPRNGLAAVNASTGQTLPWILDANSVVTALAVVEDTLVVGGSFTNLGGEPRSSIAAVDLSSGSLMPWAPVLDGGVLCLAAFDQLVYVGGAFHVVEANPASALAAASFARSGPAPVPVPPRISLMWVAPNPVRTSAIVRIALPAARNVDLAVYDVQGRRVSALLVQTPLSAGTHDVPLRAEGWPGGVYVLRLRAADGTATWKFVVIR